MPAAKAPGNLVGYTKEAQSPGYMVSPPHIVLPACFAFLFIASHSPAAPTDSQWLDVPFVRQVRAGCGSAAVAMVMQYWAGRQSGLDTVAADAAHIDQVLPPSSAKGIQGRALKQYFEEHGFTAFVFSGDVQDLQRHLAKGRPVLVSIAPNGSRAPLHYVVVVGLRDKTVMVNDPARGKLVDMDLERFQPAWKTTGNWALLAVPRADSQPLPQQVR